MQEFCHGLLTPSISESAAPREQTGSVSPFGARRGHKGNTGGKDQRVGVPSCALVPRDWRAWGGG